ncbi:hypothetical protein QUA54_28445 [Microcoleus sp. MOSTC5]|uniref:hypothetical protein n=1 Tax=Microcoleus sp. MOSTC5 TaxID=3055378 RepID=UPI002FD42E47
MELEEYEKRLTELELGNLPDFSQKMAQVQAEYLSEQAVPDAETAIRLIREAQQRGELPELDMVSVPETDWECEFLELKDNGRPDQGTWRCRNDNFVIDVAAEDGEVNLISV